MQQQDREYMALAIMEAQKGSGRTSPNPVVGAVIVKNGVIKGRGYHKKAGTPHAEVNAIADAGKDLLGATMYVTLEPCNHTGRTPPCTSAILKTGISRVVIGMYDPHAVASGGAEYLRTQGIMVETGVLEKKCRQLNYPFIKHTVSKLPWVIMKAGLSLDGRITLQPNEAAAITGKESKQYVHNLRDKVDAILIGIDTAIIDDPSLTTRLESGVTGQDPLRVILDTHLRLTPQAQILTQQSDAATWVFCSKDAPVKKAEELNSAGAVVHRVDIGLDGKLDLVQVLGRLAGNNCTAVLVEGGAGVHGGFLDKGLVDEVYLLYAPFFIGESGTPLVRGFAMEPSEERFLLKDVSVMQLGRDVLLHGYFNVL